MDLLSTTSIDDVAQMGVWRVFGYRHREVKNGAYQRLMTLMDAAALNRFDANEQTMDEQLVRLNAYCEKISRADSGLRLTDILRVGHEQCFDLVGLKRCLYDVQKLFMQSEIPFLYLLFVARSIERNRESGRVKIGLVNGRTVDTPLDLKLAANDKDKAKAPYLVLARLRAGPSNTVQWIDGYAQPIFSESEWIAVDSEMERKTLKGIRSAMAINVDAARLRAIKPVKDVSTHLGECRPDFVLIDDGSKRRLVVETMGYSDAQYTAKKASTHPRMEYIGSVVRDWRTKSANDLEADRRLEGQIVRWIQGLKAANIQKECA